MFFTTLLLAEPSGNPNAAATSQPIPLVPAQPIFTGPLPVVQQIQIFLEVEVMPDDDVWELDVMVVVQDSEDEEDIWLVAEEQIRVPGDRDHATVMTLTIPATLEFLDRGTYRLRAFAGQTDSDNYVEAPWKWLFVA